MSQQELIDAITGMREEDAVRIAGQMLDAGADPLDVLQACSQAMEIIGKGFEDEQFFISELILAGMMLSRISELLKPHLAHVAPTKKFGKVVVGTVQATSTTSPRTSSCSCWTRWASR